MTYKEAFKNIRSDYRRYSELYPNGGRGRSSLIYGFMSVASYIYSGSA